MHNVLVNTLVGVAGISIGYVGNGFIAQNTQVPTDKPVYINSSDSSTDNSKPQNLANTNPTLLQIAVDENIVSDIENVDDGNELGATEERFEVASTEATTSVVKLLKGKHVDMYNTGELDNVIHGFDEWLYNTENPAQQLFTLLQSDIDDSEKHLLEWLIARDGAIGGTNENLANSIVEALAVASEVDFDHWTAVLEMANINTTSARNALLNTLPVISDEGLVSASLMAMQPDLIAPAERTQFLSDLSVFSEYSSEAISSAALMSLGQWSAHDYAHVIENALLNGTEQQRMSAIYAIADGTIRSDTIKHQLLKIMNDESLLPNMRLEAFSALSYFSHDEQEYAQYYQFHQTSVTPLLSQAN